MQCLWMLLNTSIKFPLLSTVKRIFTDLFTKILTCHRAQTYQLNILIFNLSLTSISWHRTVTFLVLSSVLSFGFLGHFTGRNQASQWGVCVFNDFLQGRHSTATLTCPPEHSAASSSTGVSPYFQNQPSAKLQMTVDHQRSGSHNIKTIVNESIKAKELL